ncbi:hypothetical protein D3C87_1165140 [compost metagenome]
MADKFFPLGNNIPIKAVDNGDGTYSVSVSGTTGGGGGVDRELAIVTYQAKNAFTGASVGDMITATRAYDVSATEIVQVGDTVWRNESTNLELATPPNVADLSPMTTGGGITNAQMTTLMNAQNAILGPTDEGVIAASPNTASSLNALFRGLWNYGIGKWNDTAAADPTETANVISILKGMWRDWKARGNATSSFVTGNVANGTDDSGNPVKIGAIYNNAQVTVATGQRTNLQATVNGSLLVVPENGGALNDSATTAYANNARNGADVLFGSVSMVYDGTGYIRQRGGLQGTMVQGGTAHGATDAGNPVKIGGAYVAAGVTLATGQRGDLQLTQQGHVKSTLFANGTGSAISVGGTNADTITPLASTSPALNTLSYGLVYDGANWNRARGNTAGAYVQGHLASGVADAGNPIKVGGKFNNVPPVFADGQRADLQLDSRGNVKMGIWSGADQAIVSNMVGDDVSPGTVGLTTRAFGYVYDSAGNWDRMRGDATGISANVLKQPLAARKIQVTAVSAEVQLTAATKRVSMYARGCDCRFRISAATGTAIATTDHFIAAGERLEFEMPNATPWIQAIAADLQSATGQLEITELS